MESDKPAQQPPVLVVEMLDSVQAGLEAVLAEAGESPVESLSAAALQLERLDSGFGHPW